MPRSSSPSTASKSKNLTTMPASFNKNIPAITSSRPSFLQTMKEGLAFGVGNSLAHRIVGTMGQPSLNKLIDNNQEYEQCMKDNNDKLGCEHILKSTVNHR